MNKMIREWAVLLGAFVCWTNAAVFTSSVQIHKDFDTHRVNRIQSSQRSGVDADPNASGTLGRPNAGQFALTASDQTVRLEDQEEDIEVN
jgi:hypothetical protein